MARWVERSTIRARGIGRNRWGKKKIYIYIYISRERERKESKQEEIENIDREINS